MVTCSIVNCKNRGVKNGPIRFFSFPKDEAVANVWLQYCGPKTSRKHGRVCSVHFLPGDYHLSLRHILMKEKPRTCRALKPNAIPTLHLNLKAQSSSRAKPKIESSSETDMEIIQHDPLLTERKELTNGNNLTSYSAKPLPQIVEHYVEIQTTETSSNTITIPISEYEDLLKIKNHHRTIYKKLAKILSLYDDCRLMY